MVTLARFEHVTAWHFEAEAYGPDFVDLKLGFPNGGTGARFRSALPPDRLKVAGGFSGGGWHWHLYGVAGSAVNEIVFDTSQGARSVHTVAHADFACRFWYIFLDPLMSVAAFRLYDKEGQIIDTIEAPEWFESSRLSGIESTKRVWDERLGE